MAPKKNRPPEDWENFSTIGTVIPDTRFIAFKTPLKPELQWKVPHGGEYSSAWGRAELERACPNLGLIIDLTYTDKYCDLPRLAASRGIKYRRIAARGLAIPPKEDLDEFIEVVNDYLAETSEEEEEDAKLIGVTCTYGVNRAGYFISQYLVDQMDYDPDKAIGAFNKARGHSMDRHNYLKFIRTGVWERGY